MPGERGLEEPALCRHGYRLGTGVGAQLLEDRGHVVADGAFGEEAQASESRRRFMRSWPESDGHSLLVPGISDLWAASMAEAFRQGAKGLIYDTILGEGHPRGFRLVDIA